MAILTVESSLWLILGANRGRFEPIHRADFFFIPRILKVPVPKPELLRIHKCAVSCCSPLPIVAFRFHDDQFAQSQGSPLLQIRARFWIGGTCLIALLCSTEEKLHITFPSFVLLALVLPASPMLPVGGGLRQRQRGRGLRHLNSWDVAVAAPRSRREGGRGWAKARGGEGGDRGCGGRRGMAVTKDFVLEIYVLILCCKFGDDF